jgi:hypothetical protein
LIPWLLFCKVSGISVMMDDGVVIVFSPYFNDTRWRETVMPSIFWKEVV